MYQHWGPTPKYSDLIGLAAQVAQVQRAPFAEKIFIPRVPQPPGAQVHCTLCEWCLLCLCRLYRLRDRA